MAKSVFILGAGASKGAGAPLMGDFLDIAEGLWLTGKVQGAEASFEEVFKARAQLSRVHSKSWLDIRNVESVFAAFEMARILGRFGEYTKDRIELLPGAMKIVIARTIEETVLFPTRDKIFVPGHYADFAGLLTELRGKANPKQTIAVLTFNYDLALDYAFYEDRIVPDYGLGQAVEPNSVPLLKLHGSMNWAKCECGDIIARTFGDYLRAQHIVDWRNERQDVVFASETMLNGIRHCDKSVLSGPMIVPPTWNKSQQYMSLARVWNRAAVELSEAENIFVVGYSLPDTDVFFRYLFALGTVGEAVLKKFVVLNPDPAVAEKFRSLLGPGALQAFQHPEDKKHQVFEGIREPVLEALGIERRGFLVGWA